MRYDPGDLVILRGRVLSRNDNTFFVGIVVGEKDIRYTRELDDMWNTKELIWEKVYKVLAHSRILEVTFYDIKGKAQ